MPNLRNRYPARRRFLKQSAALTASASLAAPAAAVLLPADAQIELRLVGAGAALEPVARRVAAAIGAALSRPVRVCRDEASRTTVAGLPVLWLAAVTGDPVDAPRASGARHRLDAAHAPRRLAALTVDSSAFVLLADADLPREVADSVRAAALAAVRGAAA